MGPQLDFNARSAFLAATQRIAWPKRKRPLDALKDDVAPLYRVFFETTLETNSQLLRSELDRPFAKINASTFRPTITLVAALKRWAGEFRFQDEWILDAAHVTVKEWGKGFGLDPLRWYVPGRAVHPEPLILPSWDSNMIDYAAYYQFAKSRFEQHMRVFKQVVAEQVRIRVNSTDTKVARWTAMHFAGSTFGEIAQRTSLRDSGPISRQAVHGAVHRFSTRAGLTLPGVN